VALLFALGGGWAWTLLPADPVIRTCVAPALGIATSVLVAFAWDRVGLSLAGSIALVPMALSAVTGWGAGVWLALRRRGRVDTRGVVGSKELQHS
jgi:hypothetical protein